MTFSRYETLYYQKGKKSQHSSLHHSVILAALALRIVIWHKLSVCGSLLPFRQSTGNNVSGYNFRHHFLWPPILHTCILAYLHTCILAYLHTCILAYLHTCYLYQLSSIRVQVEAGERNILLFETFSSLFFFTGTSYRGFHAPKNLNLTLLSVDLACGQIK